MVSTVTVTHAEGPAEAVPLLHVLAHRIKCQCGSVRAHLCSFQHVGIRSKCYHVTEHLKPKSRRNSGIGAREVVTVKKSF